LLHRLHCYIVLFIDAHCIASKGHMTSLPQSKKFNGNTVVYSGNLACNCHWQEVSNSVHFTARLQRFSCYFSL